VMSVNATSVFLCMKFEIRQMLQQGKGAIVNTASIAGLVGSRVSPAYAASKHAVVGLTKTAALQYAKSGIRINAVCPGSTKTPMVAALFGTDAAQEEAFASLYPIGRLAEPAEIAQAALWLNSDAASFMVGHALAVDGGWVAQ
jgi:NAD(P)-dependent dehydrogenase (short-subunit alcohol dehydrogenase family)